MKIRSLLLLALCITLTLAACRPAATDTGTEVPPATEAPAAETEAPAVPEATPVEANATSAPAGEQPYPAQGAEVEAAAPVETSPPYPAPGQAETIDWAQAEEIILSGNVIQIQQATASLKVTLVLNDGRTLETTEPALDEVIRVIERCGSKCNPWITNVNE
jgi:hypothetical protein